MNITLTQSTRSAPVHLNLTLQQPLQAGHHRIEVTPRDLALLVADGARMLVGMVGREDRQ